MAKLYIPGLAEYGQCKIAFLRLQELLTQEQTPEHKTELADLLQTLDTNTDAVDFLQAEFGPEYARVYGRAANARMPAFLLDESAADNGTKRLPSEWYDYWADIKDGKVMASMGDLYHSFKIIKKMHEQGTEQEHAKAKSLLFSLRDDCDWTGKQNWLISSTRLFYSGTNLDARIVQHYRCPRPALVKETIVEAPVYRRTPVKKILNEQKGLAYLQALFDTEDKAETILQTLEFVSGKHGDSLVGWTANTNADDTQYTRTSHPERAAGFGFGYDLFHVGGDGISSGPGCSRRVRCEP